MQYYKKLMALVIGLFFAIFSGSFCAEFIEVTEWYLTLPLPSYTPSGGIFQIAWLITYLLSAILLSDTIATTVLRKNTLFWVIIYLLQPIWCFVFFTLHYLVLSLVILTGLFFIQLLLFFKTVSIKKWTPIFMLPILIWYMLLISLVYGTILSL